MGSNKTQGHSIPKWMPSSCHRYLKDENYIVMFTCRRKRDPFLLIFLYVDDLIITSGSVAGLRRIKSYLSKEFSMIDLGMLRQFIGLEVNKKASRIMIT